MDKEKNDKKVSPPYLPYRTLKNFLDAIGVTPPSRIDRSVMPNISGTLQSWLMVSLKYLKLIREDGTTEERLVKLVKASEQEKRKMMREIIQSSYPFVFDNINLQSATPKQLEEQFANHTAATGETVRKCIAFFLAAAKDSGIEISQFLQKMKYTKSNGQRVRPRGALTQLDPDVDDLGEQQQQPSLTALLMSKFPTFDPAWPDEVKAKWFDGFKQMMDTMKERE